MKICSFATLLLLSAGLYAQNWTAVSASNLTDLNQQKLAAGSLCFLATDQNDVPISFGVGGGGQALARPFCVTVTNGASAALTVPNPQNTQPQGIYYRVSVTDSASGQVVLRYRQVAFTGGAFNLDNYTPTSIGSFIPISGNAVNGNLSVNGGASITGAASAASLSIASSMASPKLTVGSLGVNNSVDSQVLISRAVDDSISGNGHAFSDSSTISRGSGGPIGYNSYDCRGQHSGSNNFDHYACLQNGWTFAGTGTITNLYGFVDVPAVNSGTATNRFGAKIFDATGSGIITNNYGIDVAALTRGATLNYAVKTEGATKSSFGGNIRGNRYTCGNASVLSVGDASLGAGWGSTASITAVTGTDCGAVITVASSGIGQGSNPVVTLTFHDGAWTNEAGSIAPVVVVNRADANSPFSATVTQGCSATLCNFTFNGTPVAGNSYSFEFITIGR